MEQLHLLITDIEKLRWKNANEQLNRLLYKYRSVLELSHQVEIADYNKLKIVRKKYLIEKYLRDTKPCPFVFFIHLN